MYLDTLLNYWSHYWKNELYRFGKVKKVLKRLLHV